MRIDPGSLRIVSYPSPALREVARPVDRVTDEVRALAARMVELMREAEGIGLAATQVGVGLRLFVAEVPPSEDGDEERSLTSDPVSATAGPVVYINPVLSDPERDLLPMEEGCLSLPEIRGEVRRPSRVTMSALDDEGRPFTLRGGGLLARCWQHETDHLDGVLIIDRMTQLARMKNRQAVKRLEEEALSRGRLL